jgi:hypothetical protein
VLFREFTPTDEHLSLLQDPVVSHRLQMTITATQERTIFLTHVVATWFMVGMIWTIQTVHYPLFADVGPESYVGYQAAHVDRIGPLLVVPWLVEGLTLLALMWLAFLGGRGSLRIPVGIGAVAMAVILVISGFWSAPAHGELADGFDAAVHDRLMTANLIRTLAWTVRGVAAAWILWLMWPRPAPLTNASIET